eukprot:2267739-Alexandrium_andersonii.AAC.1
MFELQAEIPFSTIASAYRYSRATSGVAKVWGKPAYTSAEVRGALEPRRSSEPVAFSRGTSAAPAWLAKRFLPRGRI